MMEKQSAKHQYITVCVVNLLMVNYGITCGWPSPNIELLTSKDTPLASGPITLEEGSWIASILCIGGLVGNILFGIVTARYGRKRPLLFLTIPTIVSWLLILFAQNAFHLIVSRAINGIVGGGLFAIAPIFFSEVANDCVRGVLGSTLILSLNIGILLGFTFGAYFSYFMTPIFSIILAIFFAITFYFFPESPTFLVKQNRISDAEDAIRFYQNIAKSDKNYEQFLCEVNKLRRTNDDFEIGGQQKLRPLLFKWSDLINGPGARALAIGIVLMILNQFCGCFAMLNYTSMVFKESGSEMPANVAAIIVGVIQLIGSCFPIFLVERTGRKFLFITSTIGTILGLIVLGVYMMLKTWQYSVDTFNWIPLISFGFVIFIASWAILTLPFLVISEVMPKHLKEFGISFCMTLLWLFAFIVIKCLPLLNDLLEFHGTMFFFAGICICCLVFVIFRMPETRGKSYEQIMRSL